MQQMREKFKKKHAYTSRLETKHQTSDNLELKGLNNPGHKSPEEIVNKLYSKLGLYRKQLPYKIYNDRKFNFEVPENNNVPFNIKSKASPKFEESTN